MSITIPTSALSPQAAQPQQDNVEAPSTPNLLMAAAEMNRMGRLPFLSDYWGGLKQLEDISKGFKTNPRALRDFPLSTNIEDRRGEKYYGSGRKGMMERTRQDLTNEILK